MNIAFLIAMALLEYGQAIADLWAQNWPRAVIMTAAGSSSVALMWVCG
jgi:hypothetical protein